MVSTPSHTARASPRIREDGRADSQGAPHVCRQRANTITYSYIEKMPAVLINTPIFLENKDHVRSSPGWTTLYETYVRACVHVCVSETSEEQASQVYHVRCSEQNRHAEYKNGLVPIMRPTGRCLKHPLCLLAHTAPRVDWCEF